MTAPKYRKGNKIHTVGEFERSNCMYFKVLFGGTNARTIHRGFLVSWTYMTLKRFIDRGWVFEAERISDV